MARISNGLTPLVADEVGDAVGQHPGLARPGARHHQQRPVGVDDRVGLDRVEPLEQVADGVVDVPLGVDAGGRAERRPPRCQRCAVGADLGVGRLEQGNVVARHGPAHRRSGL